MSGKARISREPTTILSGYDAKPPTQEKENFPKVRSPGHLFKVSELNSSPEGSQSRSVHLWSLFLKSWDYGISLKKAHQMGPLGRRTSHTQSRFLAGQLATGLLTEPGGEGGHTEPWAHQHILQQKNQSIKTTKIGFCKMRRQSSQEGKKAVPPFG